MLTSLDLHTVRPGDTLTRIAKQYGIADWRTIYYAPENAEFRRKRPNPDRIFPGDRIVIARDRPGPSFDVPPGPPVIGSTPPPQPPTPPAPPPPPGPTFVENVDFALALPAPQRGKVGFDCSNGAAVHPHDPRPGVRPWLMLPEGRSRELQLVRRNTQAPALADGDVEFSGLGFANLGPAAGNGPRVVLTGKMNGMGVGSDTLTAIHRPTGRFLASVEVHGVAAIIRRSALLVRVQLHNDWTTRSDAAVRAALREANSVHFEQANVRWADGQVADTTTHARPDGALDAGDLDPLWLDLKKRKNVAAGNHVVVFFVRKLTDRRNDGAVPVNGVTVGTTDTSLRGLIAISDTAKRPGETLAHELGHLSGLDLGHVPPLTSRSFDRNIMFKDDGQVRDTFYREQIERMRRLRS